ncbi:hypothetical protein [Marinobacter mangrovi]|uniref:hypothetical protein n=1 Tax=Marinobacter mangrovi TaxID=2803918 RepID=UPI0019348159|nr:hypothetical protein [Marinobacter mangrovi]
MPESAQNDDSPDHTNGADAPSGYRMVSHGAPGGRIDRSVSYSWSIPIPFLKQRLDPDENGNSLYQGEGELSSQTRSSDFNYVVSLLLLLLPGIVYVFSMGEYTNPNLWFGTFIGSIFLVKSLRNSLGLHRFGATRLRLEAAPVIGKKLSGRIAFVRDLPKNQPIKLKLICYEGVKRNTTSGSRTDYVEYWRADYSTRLQNDQSKQAFFFSFDVPADLPPNDMFEFRWSLELEGQVGRHRLARTWSVPMELPLEASDHAPIAEDRQRT